MTDGDIRRWLSTTSEIDLEAPVSSTINPQFLSLPESTPPQEIDAHFSDRIKAIPLTDTRGRLVGIALPGLPELVIGDRLIGENQPSFLIAEIGNNHNGDVDLGRRLVDLAAEAGADCAKFQMRDISALYGDAANKEADAQDLGAQYTMDLLSRFNLGQNDLYTLFDHCRDHGMEPMCTPWDLPSLKALETYGMAAYKVASADLTNHELLAAMAATGKPLICSTGMSRESEIREGAAIMRRAGAPFALLHCNSTYPAPYKDINLGYMKRLAELEGCPVGYSGHERGWAVPIAAVSLGASIVEKHFTVDRSMEGNDHRVSLLPDEFSEMVKAIRNVEQAMLGNADQRELTQGEMMNREVLAKSVYATVDVPEGTEITEDMLSIRSPGQGLQPNRLNALIGRKALRDVAAGTPFFPADLDDSRVGPRPFNFGRPWGIPVRWHDWKPMATASNVDLLEYHLSYTDLETELTKWFDEPQDLDLVVHAPELFKGDHILDLSSEDEDYRKHSVAEMQRVINITRELKKWHTRSTTPVIITNVGGFNAEGFLPKSSRQKLYDNVARSWGELDTEGVEIIPQTMPPFPWHFGGQSHHNLFVDPQEIVDFCSCHNARVCFDVSHSQLACNHFGWSMSDFVDAVGPYSAHLHIVDARGVDGEGLQIGEGDIDFAALCGGLNRVCKDASFVPEVWQGHKDSGAGFWFALDALERWFNHEQR
ncbi:MAG: N-acetylneuraminate synthase family protein [Paracoccaceae bacterium]